MVSKGSGATASSGKSQPRRGRSIIMLDQAPLTALRVESGDVARRAALERRKLREIIEFCYTEHCYRAHILDYFGDRHHARRCGTCGNCAPTSPARTPLIGDELVSATVPSSRKLKGTKAASVPSLRALTTAEHLRVRKILACAARLKGRFGKTILANTLRGSAAKAIMQSHLNELSTYGILKEMRLEELLILIDSLVAAECLKLSGGNYPTVSITDLGERVMREQAQVELRLD